MFLRMNVIHHILHMDQFCFQIYAHTLGKKRRMLENPTSSMISCISMSSQGNMLFQGFDNGAIMGNDITSAKRKWSFSLGKQRIEFIYASGMNSLLLVASKRDAVILQSNVGTVEFLLDPYSGAEITSAAFDGMHAVFGHSDGFLVVFDISIAKWDIAQDQSATVKPKISFAAHEGAITGCVTNSECTMVATCGQDKAMRLWQFEDILRLRKDSILERPKAHQSILEAHLGWITAIGWSCTAAKSLLVS